MSSPWYCTDCETSIDRDAIDEHEAEGHAVRGTIRPDRLLGNDPWNAGIEGGAADGADERDREGSRPHRRPADGGGRQDDPGDGGEVNE